jgi:polar amino acid transport system permease protein
MTATAPAKAPVVEDRPGLIEARPVRHPGRWVAIAVLVVLALMLANLLVNNPAFNWPFVFQAMNQSPVLEGFWKGTILVTILAMLFGVALGVLLAVMRLSDNPVLRGVSWVYTWFFRAIPRYVLLTIMGALGILFQQGIAIGVPFDWLIIDWLGLSGDWRIATFDANAVFVGLAGGVIGLAASEAAYMAEIARAGILSVDKGRWRPPRPSA